MGEKRFFFSYIVIYLCFLHVTHLPGEPRVHWLRAPFAQERSVLDAFEELCLGPYAARARVPQLQVVRHGGRVGRQLEKVETTVQTGAADLVDSRNRVFFPVVVVAVCAAATAPATATDDDDAAAATITGQRTLVVASAGVCVATASTSIVATACQTQTISLKSLPINTQTSTKERNLYDG